MLSPLEFPKYMFQPNETKQYTKSTNKIKLWKEVMVQEFSP